MRLIVDAAGLVAYPARRAAAERGVRTGGDPRNRDYVAGHLDSTASAGAEALCFDPQTSGGLLAAVDPDVAAELGGGRVRGPSARSRAATPAVVLR